MNNTPMVQTEVHVEASFFPSTHRMFRCDAVQFNVHGRAAAASPPPEKQRCQDARLRNSVLGGLGQCFWDRISKCAFLCLPNG